MTTKRLDLGRFSVPEGLTLEAAAEARAFALEQHEEARMTREAAEAAHTAAWRPLNERLEALKGEMERELGPLREAVERASAAESEAAVSRVRADHLVGIVAWHGKVPDEDEMGAWWQEAGVPYATENPLWLGELRPIRVSQKVEGLHLRGITSETTRGAKKQGGAKVYIAFDEHGRIVGWLILEPARFGERPHATAEVQGVPLFPEAEHAQGVEKPLAHWVDALRAVQRPAARARKEG